MALRARPRRRAVGGHLTAAEHQWLRWGSTPYLPPDTAAGFIVRDGAGGYHVDEAAARRAWQANRSALLAETRPDGLIPAAARHFEGMDGKVSRYERLRDPDHETRPS